MRHAYPPGHEHRVTARVRRVRAEVAAADLGAVPRFLTAKQRAEQRAGQRTHRRWQSPSRAATCPIQVALTGYLVDASFDGDLDPYQTGLIFFGG